MTQKSRYFLSEKNIRKTKREHAVESFGGTYYVEILNSFNLQLQLKDTESAIKSKLIELLTQLKGYKFVIVVLNKLKSRNDQ